MKRLLPALFLLSVLFPVVCSASGYVLVNYGIGGKVDEPSLGVEIGGIFLSDLHPSGGALSLGLGVSVADTDEDPPSGLQPTTPAPAYTAVNEFNEGDEQEINVTFGAEMIPSFFAVGGIGYSTQDTETIGVSDSQLFEVDTDTDENVTWMLGARYVIEGLNLGLGFHSRRGIMAGVGIAF